jgi:mono/diheme cytochrome c family protein
MSRSRILMGAIVLLLVAAAGAFALTWRPEIAPAARPYDSLTDVRMIRAGAELATIGNCVDCHTSQSGGPFAGGRAIPTPFGTIYSSNITPDAETGIGSWSEAAFLRSMHEGVDRRGQHLYPAFPYDHFAKATEDDVRAIYLFLMSQTAVRHLVPANLLGFPFNFRPVVAGWKLLFLSEARVVPNRAKSPEWNRGRYLVEGLGHCGACHTPRNVLGGEKRSSAYAGGSAEGWFAPPFGGSDREWTRDQLTEYLSSGWHRTRGAAAGPMADVTRNMGLASPEDVAAIAEYVSDIAKRAARNRRQSPTEPERGTAVASGEAAAIYAGACANCHDGQGDVGPSKALPLRLSAALKLPGPSNAVRVILRGIQHTPGGGPYMPSFGDLLSDAQIASLADHLRKSHRGGPRWEDTLRETSNARREGS